MQVFYDQIGLKCIDLTENKTQYTSGSKKAKADSYHVDLFPIYYETDSETFDSSGFQYHMEIYNTTGVAADLGINTTANTTPPTYNLL